MEGMTFITLKSWVFFAEGGSELIAAVAFCIEMHETKEDYLGRRRNYLVNYSCYVGCFKK